MRVLFLSRWFPHHADNGSKIRILNLLSHLAREHDVTLLSFGEPEDVANVASRAWLAEQRVSARVLPYRAFRPSSRKAIVGLVSPKPRSLVDTYSSAMQSVIEAEIARAPFDLLIASQLDMVPYVMAVPRVPAILEELELSGFQESAMAANSVLQRLRARLMWLKLVAYVKRSLPRFQACTVASDIEAARLRKIAPEYANIHVVSNAIDLAGYQGTYRSPAQNTLVYAGALTYSANYDAVDYFLRDVYPGVARAVPGVLLRVTGRQDGVDLAALPPVNGVQYTGYLRDIRPVIAESWASVVPLRKGGGTRLKILESLALGTPVVTTRKGAEGLDVQDGEHMLIAGTTEQFTDRLVSLLGSSQLRARLAANGRQLVQAKYDAAVIGRQLCTLAEQSVPARVHDRSLR